MNSSKKSYKELGIPYFKEVFEIIDQTMIDHKIPYYIIGVSAIALELLKNGIKPNRGTKDIDFAIMISTMNQYEKLSETLVNKGFTKVKAPWTFYSQPFHVAIDILPFGEIEEQDTMQFNERYSDLHILGFKEVLEDSEQVQIEEKIVNIPPLAGMIILKLIAWSDRPEERENDLSDILRIIEHYFDHNFNEIIESHHDIFGEDEFDQILISAEVLGRKARKILAKSKELESRIIYVLEQNLKSEFQSTIARDWATKKDWTVEYALKVFKSLYTGMQTLE